MSLVIAVPGDLTGFEALQQRAWGCSALDVVPAHLLQAHSRHGACLLGAWQDGQLIGLAYAFPGPIGQAYLCSHLAAVAPEWQGQGVGRQLKLAQAQWAREHGYARIVWTFDPLQGANAQLNIGRLGAVCQRYLVNYYGDLDDDLNRGVSTDRFEVDWWLNGVERGPVVQEVCFPWPLPRESRGHWRQLTAERFQEAFGRGLAVTAFDIRQQQACYQLSSVRPL